jgi:hypothetical protein
MGGRCVAAIRQAGQALAEGLIAVLALALVVLAIAHAGRWHATALQTGFAARQAAFAWTRGESGAGGDDRVRLQPLVAHPLPGAAQPGGEGRDAGTLRRQWALHDDAVVAWQARAMGLRLPFGVRRLSLRRHTAVLADAGHATGDVGAQQRTAQSTLAWRDAASGSLHVAREIDARVAPVDRAWRRPGLALDWLAPWAGAVPPEHVRDRADAWRFR